MFLLDPRKYIDVQINKLHKDAIIPFSAHSDDAGVDLHSIENRVIQPGDAAIVRTGIALAIPKGWEFQVRSRSGMAAKYSVFVTNSPGTIDSGYRGEIKVILINLGDKPYLISRGDRIAQLVLKPVYFPIFNEVDELPDSDRGSGGFGSSGK